MIQILSLESLGSRCLHALVGLVVVSRRRHLLVSALEVRADAGLVLVGRALGLHQALLLHLYFLRLLFQEVRIREVLALRFEGAVGWLLRRVRRRLLLLPLPTLLRLRLVLLSQLLLVHLKLLSVMVFHFQFYYENAILK